MKPSINDVQHPAGGVIASRNSLPPGRRMRVSVNAVAAPALALVSASRDSRVARRRASTMTARFGVSYNRSLTEWFPRNERNPAAAGLVDQILGRPSAIPFQLYLPGRAA